MFGCRRLADVELASYEEAANSIFHQITIALPWEMAARVFEPLQDLQPALVPQGLNRRSKIHRDQLDNKLIDYAIMRSQIASQGIMFFDQTQHDSSLYWLSVAC